jgi:hypothetical protein
MAKAPQSTTEWLTPIEAIGAERWQAYRAAREACRDIPALIAPRIHTEEQQTRLARRSAAYKAAFGPVLDAWERGEWELWAWHRDDPTKPPELVQPIARPRLQWQLDKGIFRSGLKFLDARFRRPTGVPPRGETGEQWLADAVKRHAAARDVPIRIGQFAKQLAAEMANSGVKHPYEPRTIENRLHALDLWPVKAVR